MRWPFLFEFQRHGMPAEESLGRLDSFLTDLAKDLRYAGEIRNGGLLGSEYHNALAAHRIAHVYNHWSYMPAPADQHKRMESFTAPFAMLRLLTRLKRSYEQAKKWAEPYTKIVEEIPAMRSDTEDVVRRAVGEGRSAYVLVNNRAEGNAPLAIQAMVDSFYS